MFAAAFDIGGRLDPAEWLGVLVPGGERHGDTAIAGALAWFASRAEYQEYGYTPVAMGAPAALRRVVGDAGGHSH